MGQGDPGSMWTRDSNKCSQCGQPVAGNQQNSLAATCPASASLLTWRVSQPTLTNLPYAKLHTLLLNHLAAVPVDGRVSAWGWDGCGQLGTGGTASACQPKHVIVPLCTHVSAESGFSSAVAKSS